MIFENKCVNRDIVNEITSEVAICPVAATILARPHLVLSMIWVNERRHHTSHVSFDQLRSYKVIDEKTGDQKCIDTCTSIVAAQINPLYAVMVYGEVGACHPLPWASVYLLVQCTLECHWNVTGWPSVHCDITGRPSEYLQGTLKHHWQNLVETVPHWNATGET